MVIITQAATICANPNTSFSILLYAKNIIVGMGKGFSFISLKGLYGAVFFIDQVEAIAVGSYPDISILICFN